MNELPQDILEEIIDLGKLNNLLNGKKVCSKCNGEYVGCSCNEGFVEARRFSFSETRALKDLKQLLSI